MKTCPNCSKPIQDDTVKCPYCGETTNNDDVNKLIQQMKNKSSKNIFSSIVATFFTLLFGTGYVLGFIVVAGIVFCVLYVIGWFIFR